MRRAVRATALMAAVLVAACSGQPAGDGDDPASASTSDGGLGVIEVAAGESIEIRWVLYVSATSESGRIASRIVRIAVDDYGPIRGFDVDLGAGIDDSCTPEGGAAAAETVVALGDAAGVIGTTCSAAAVGAAPVISEAGLVMVSPTNSSPALTSDLAGGASEHHHRGYYRTAHNDLHQGMAVAQFLHEAKGVTKVAAIHEGDAYTQGLVEAFVTAYEALGGEVTSVGVVGEDHGTDMVPLLEELAAGSPQALFFPLTLPAANFVVQQARTVSGLGDVILVGGDAMLTDPFMTVEESEGVFLSGPNVDMGDNVNQSTGAAAADLFDAYRSLYGVAPAFPFAGHAYDATTLLLEAVEAASRLEGDTLVIDRAAIRQHLDAVSGYRGLIGTIACDHFGDCGVPRITVIEHLDPTNPDPSRNNTVFEYLP